MPALDPYRDQTVSKILARQTAAGSRVAARAAFEDVFNSVNGACKHRFRSGRRLQGGELSEIFKAFERDFDGNVDSIAAFDGDRPATRTRPKGEAFERIRVHTSPFENDGVVWLWTTRLFASRKTAVFETSRLPFSWLQHAVARVYERCEGNMDANRQIGEALMLHNFMLSVATDLVSFEKLPVRLAIPCADGMLLGEVQELRAPEGTSKRYIYEREFGSVSTVLPQVLAWRTEAGKTCASWRAFTFIGEHEMKANQHEYVARWNELRRLFKATADRIVQIQPRMNAVIDTPEEAAPGGFDALSKEFERATDYVRQLLTDPVMSYAIGNRYVPATAPVLRAIAPQPEVEPAAEHYPGM